MHAAVWSQPTVSHKLLRRVHSDVDPPVTAAEKTVLGTGIATTLLGGLLTVLGFTGYFMSNGIKYFIGFGALAGLSAVIAGVTGVRMVGRRSLTQRHFFMFLVLGLLSHAASLTMVILGSILLSTNPDLVALTSIIGVSETAVAALIFLLTTAGLGAGIYARKDFLSSCSRPTNLGPTPQDVAATRYRPSLLPSESTSPDTTVSPVSDPEG